MHFAPLQGYTDAIYREVHAEVFGGVTCYYSPFVRLEKGEFRKKEIRDITYPGNREIPFTPQLIAATPEEFRTIAACFVREGYTQADINLGCPFPLEVKLHRGAGILPYPDEAARLLETISKFPQIRFSVKLRLGWEDAEECLALAPLLNRLPLIYVTLHPRIGKQQYKGTTDPDAFEAFYQVCTHPLIYNGDLVSIEDIHTLTNRFPKLQGIMLGRGLLARPWLATEYTTGQPLSEQEKRSKAALFHSLLMEKYSERLEGGEHQLLSKLQTIWDYFLPDAEKKLRKKVLKAQTLPAYKAAVSNLFMA
ncbi:MAG: tRNA-dihydrouridine synthase family protein [Tannerellaceae bacterium]|nr:tRNA-dihydrouridine synthase family protein [Tannerellaceae bacterium]